MPNNMTTLENLQEVLHTLDKCLSANLEHNNVYMTREQILAVRKVLSRETLLEEEQSKYIIIE